MFELTYLCAVTTSHRELKLSPILQKKNLFSRFNISLDERVFSLVHFHFVALLPLTTQFKAETRIYFTPCFRYRFRTVPLFAAAGKRGRS